MSAKDAWDWGLGRWEAYFGLVLVATIIYVLNDHLTATGLVATGLLLALVPWYVLFGRRFLGRETLSPGPYVYVAGLIVLCSAAALTAPESSLVLFAACAQCFMIVRWRESVAALVLLNAVPAVRFMRGDADAGTVVSFVVWTVVVIGFSAFFGLWIERIIGQSAERRELIRELETTRAELAEVSREAGVMAERERMAGEIHDTLAQGFTSILMLLQAADAYVGRDPEEARRQVGLAARTARENLAEARALVAALPPAPLGGSSLDEAVGRLTERMSEELGVTADYDLTGEPRRLTAGAEVVLLRIAQEGLANVRRHAKADRVEVRLAYAPASVRLEIRDDGVGFGPGTARGFGLHGMRERVGQVGGTFDVRSEPGAGTTVTVEVPA
ncbi:sensor histidine kinase [Actinoallomurus rhizosphaericola]|uniref:sensor histidine kinase n=1 Tax=Actinoallomurus rhizosphaericola TaxID=2952536 RepID=UPI0020908391|nr:sensor histidine kinase [Actinoallomurus rhizosphaericola]MCO5993960.1 sensor histidine kinase [Actinoallomurus rhizosphaericola]